MTAVDLREFVRFLLAGATATAVNLSVVWVALSLMSFEVALLFGIAAGLSASFLLSKLCAFRSRAWAASSDEIPRFLVVYTTGVALYWLVAMAGRHVLADALPEDGAAMAGVLLGAAVMTFTSYFGHRFFTFRTHTRP